MDTDSADEPAVTLADVEAAAERLAAVPEIEETPVVESATLGRETGADVRLKFEHLQKTGSFKPRGAYNTVAQLVASDEAVDRVVAASAGNHAQGVAFAATELGVDSLVVMPETAPQAKVDATRGYGARVEQVGETFAAAMDAAREATDDPGTAFVHAYDDPAVVAGQGTIGLELADQVPEADTVVVPIGGGGLISGVATALAELDADTRVVGVQAEGAATVPDSLAKGHPVDMPDPDTIADGIATGGISALTYGLIDRYVDEVVTVSDTEIATATLFLLERTKQLVEGAAATSVAALLSGTLSVAPDETVVPLLCGGNVDTATLQDVLTRALVDRQQFVTLRVRIDDQPGVLGEIAEIVGEYDTNIRSVRHDRSEAGLPVGKADLVFRVTVPGAAALDGVVGGVEDAGYEVRRVVPEAAAPDGVGEAGED
ncbi:threonine ammonia-lyase [Halobaculum sp. MBLA0147]|uniref:threonine ammonia-lyase n=1 Tax=Halobaculum sp. MBLA0147 TaxID=3079934 RepID=UPI003524E43F